MNFEELVIHISAIIAMEETLEEKLDLLTSIGITSRNSLIFQACESLRNDIIPEEVTGPKGEIITFDDF